MPELGEVRPLPNNERGWPRREQLQAIGECPRCGQQVELWAETEVWEEDPELAIVATGYGPPMGACCGLLFVIQPDGREECYRLGEQS